MKKILTCVLLAFVAASVAYAVMQAGDPSKAGAGPDDDPAGGPDRTDVLFFHPTARCATCINMQARADSLIRDDFADELADGRLTWRVLNFEHHDALADRYKVVASTLVVVTVRGGVETTFARLDDAFQHADSRDAFREYVRAAVAKSLNAPTSKSEIRNPKQLSNSKSQNPNVHIGHPGDWADRSAPPFEICDLNDWTLFRISNFGFSHGGAP